MFFLYDLESCFHIYKGVVKFIISEEEELLWFESFLKDCLLKWSEEARNASFGVCWSLFFYWAKIFELFKSNLGCFFCYFTAKLVTFFSNISVFSELSADKIFLYNKFSLTLNSFYLSIKGLHWINEHFAVFLFLISLLLFLLSYYWSILIVLFFFKNLFRWSFGVIGLLFMINFSIEFFSLIFGFCNII